MSDLDRIFINTKILIVDDDAFMRTLLNGIVKHIGFKNVIEARDGKSALSMIKEKSFDVVFCDWEMPGMNGLELYNEIKGKEELSKVTFIMITGRTGADHVKEAMENGIRHYIAKPFNDNVIRNTLAKVFAGKS